MADLEHSQREVVRLQGVIDHVLRQPAAPRQEREDRAEKLPDIPMFSGKLSELRPWIDRLNIKVGDRRRYPNLQDQLRYALSRLEGTAFDHVRPRLQPDGIINLTSVDALTNILVQAFDDPDREGTARRTLLTLRQGSDDFATLYAKFQSQVPYANMDDGSLLAAMKEAIAPKIRNTMIGIRPRPATLQDYVQLAKDIDADQRAEAERRSGVTSIVPPKKTMAAGRPATTTTTTTATGTEPGPMDLSKRSGRGAFPKLSAAERQRRIRENLCFYCGGDGHQAVACPVIPKPREPRRIATLETPGAQEESSSAAAARQESEN
jgi:hypothetical protein